jgi:putative hydrolase of the HAD superfamily
VLLDYGGVIAEEGFREGLHAIARSFRLDPEAFFAMASEAVYACGYVTGTATEAQFWAQIRRQSGIPATDEELRYEVLSRFIPRPWMIEIVRRLRGQGVLTAIVSDQSDWLDLLDRQYGFFREFDAVFNSFHLGKSKRDPTIFADVLLTLRVTPGEALFVDDNAGHIERAAGVGLLAHHFTTRAAFEARLHELIS